jgi:hypothetical protein
MALFTGIGDFFRGAFGESEDEKRRRKQREAQEAAARQKPVQQPRPQQRPQQNQQRPQQQRQQNKIVEDVNKATAFNGLFQAKKPTPPPVQQAPRVQTPKSPLPDQNFLGVSAEDTGKKNILGDKVYKTDVNTVVNTNKDKYVARFDGLKPEVKKQVIKVARQKAKEGDATAATTLKALEETGRLRLGVDDIIQRGADYAAAPGASVSRVVTGIGQGLSGLYDLATPGKGTNRVSKTLDKGAKKLDEFAKVADVEGAYKTGNVAGEIASYAIPSKAAASIASKFPKATKITEGVIEQAARVVDNAGDAGKVRRLLAEGMRKGLTVAESLEEVAISSKYMGENASKGNKTTPKTVATDIATGTAGNVGLRGISALFGRGNKVVDGVKELVDEADIDTTPAYERGFGKPEPSTREAYKAEQSALRGEGSTFKQMQDQGLDPGDANDIPAYQRNEEYRNKLVKDAQDELDNINKQLDQVPDRTIEEYKFKQQQKLAQDIQSNPGAKNALVQDHQRRMQAVDNMDNLKAYRAQLETRKQQLTKLVEDSNAVKAKNDALIAKQAEEAAKAEELRKTVKEEVSAQQAAQTAPAPGEVVQDAPVAGSPEVAVNDAAYGARQATDEIVNAGKPTFDEKGRLSIPQLFSPDRIIRENITRPGEELVNKAAYALQTSDNRLGRFFGRTGTGFSRELGVAPEVQTARMQLRGGIESGKVTRDAIGDLGKDMDRDNLTDIWATIDTEFAARQGRNVSIEDLSPDQLALRQKLIDIRDNTTVENQKRGLITKEQAANGEYINRDYSVLYEPTDEVGQFEQGFRQELLDWLLGQYKGRKKVSDAMVEQAITDPTYLVGKKQAQSEAAWAMQDYGNFLASNGNVSDVAKPGFEQLPNTPLFGDAAGKFIPKNLAEDFTGFKYDMAITSAFNDLVTAYDRLGIRQAKKALLTVFNPAVRLGNQVTNRGIFSQLNGINPVQFNIAMEQARNEIKAGGQLYREAVQQGLTGVDITQADFFAKRISDSAGGDKNIAKKAFDWTKTSYSGADDQARIAAYMVKRKQGYDPVEAARQVQRGFQDYKSVGFFYDMAAKTPLIGNAFVRFAADSVRIAKNAALDHPLRTLGTIAAWSGFVNGMSVVSGESELQGDNMASKAFNLVTGKSKSDAQKEREGRFGSPKLPFSDISTAVQTPFGEVNVARFMPWYQLNDIPGANPITRVLPFSQSPVNIEDGKLSVNPQAMNDPLLGQIVQLGMDKDFRGKSIRDPENTDNRFSRDPLSKEEQAKNALRFLFNNNAPVGREIDQFASAYGAESKKRTDAGESALPLGDKAYDLTGGKDMYGKERNIWQALARNFGFKVEEQGSKQAEDRAGLAAYQDEKAQIERELQDLSPDAQAAYKRLTGFDKLREQVDNEFAPGEKRFKKAEVYDFGEDKWKEYAAHPELYNLMVNKKQREFAKDGKPIPPEFDPKLSESFRRQLIQNKMVAPGDDAELDQRMYSSPEFDYYQNLKDEYKAQAKQYYPQNGDEIVDDETVRHQDAKFPTKPDALKAYSAAYKLYTDGKAEKPQWNDALTAQKEAYNRQTLDWTNTERAARGLPAITWDVWNNPTFGFDESPSGSGFGFGYGNRGGGSRKPAEVNTLTELTNFSDSVKRLDPIEAQAMPNIVQVFQKLMAGKGGRAKPKLGASSRGQG